MTRARHLRVVFEPGGTKPWVVQYNTDDTQTAWTDVHRFATPDRAVAYVEEIAARDRALLEASQ